MSFDHKAYALDWDSFSSELLPWLALAIEQNDCSRFEAFVRENTNVCRDPYEGEPLSEDWEETMDFTNVQQLADFALTKYYDPAEDHGLSDAWTELDESLPSELRETLLGASISGFDPGLQGSYFVSADEAKRYAALLRDVDNQAVKNYAQFLARVASRGNGVYVTF